MRKAHWERNLLELIRRTATDLPKDVEVGIRRAWRQEKRGSHAWWTLGVILENAELARKNSTPICQDSGTLIFHFRVPVGFDTNALVAHARAAVSRATRLGHLRENAVDALSGASYPTNVAPASPVFYFDQGARKTVDVRLVMKGGGCENAGRQYSLPDANLGADRDLEGVRRCVLDAVWQTQGRACAPTILGVCVGGDRASGSAYAREQFLRKLCERSRVRALARMEETLLKEIRRLDIGPMGLGGKSTVLAVKLSALSRLPACYFVTVSFMCWALRRRGAVMGREGGVHRWLY